MRGGGRVTKAQAKHASYRHDTYDIDPRRSSPGTAELAAYSKFWAYAPVCMRVRARV